MVNPKYPEAAENMVRFGGSFVQHIGRAYMSADIHNTKKLENAFPEYFQKYQNWNHGK